MKTDHLALILLSSTFAACLGDIPTGSESQGTPDLTPPTGSNTTPTPPPPPPTTATEYLQKLAVKECTKAFSCKDDPTAPAEFEQMYGDNPATCALLVTARYAPASVEAEIALLKVIYNATAADACLANMPMPSTCAAYWAQGGFGPRTCGDVFHGTASETEPCAIQLDCVDTDALCDQLTCVASPDPVDL
jgi:hypothetical protein